MKKKNITAVLTVLGMSLMLFGCGNEQPAQAQEDSQTSDTSVSENVSEADSGEENGEDTPDDSDVDFIDMGYMAYSDIISYIVEGYQDEWKTIEPGNAETSTMYAYLSQKAGFIMTDLNADGIDELVMGENYGEDPTLIYDIYTINPEDGLLIHILSCDEENSCILYEGNELVISGSEANGSFVIAGGELAQTESEFTDDQAVTLELDYFYNYVVEGDEAPEDIFESDAYLEFAATMAAMYSCETEEELTMTEAEVTQNYVDFIYMYSELIPEEDATLMANEWLTLMEGDNANIRTDFVEIFDMFNDRAMVADETLETNDSYLNFVSGVREAF